MTFNKLTLFHPFHLLNQVTFGIAPLLLAALLGGGTSAGIGLMKGENDFDQILKNLAIGGGVGALTGGVGGMFGGGAGGVASGAGAVGASTGAMVSPAIQQAAMQTVGQSMTPVAAEAAKQTFAQSMKDIASQMGQQMLVGTGSGMAMNALTPKPTQMTPPDSGMLGQQQQQMAQLAQQNMQQRQGLPTAFEIMMQNRAKMSNPYGQSRGMMA